MIIGNNNNSIEKNYKNFSNKIGGSSFAPRSKGIKDSVKAVDMRNKQDMNSQAFDVLQTRLNQGLITLDEFNRQCNKLRNNK